MKIESMIWYEVILRNRRKRAGKKKTNMAEENKDFGSMFLELLFEPGKFATDWKKSMKIVSLDIKIESMIWYEVIWRNWRKGSGKEDGRKKEKKYF